VWGVCVWCVCVCVGGGCGVCVGVCVGCVCVCVCVCPLAEVSTVLLRSQQSYWWFSDLDHSSLGHCWSRQSPRQFPGPLVTGVAMPAASLAASFVCYLSGQSVWMLVLSPANNCVRLRCFCLSASNS
jgi:hypothetical protein